MMKKILLLFVSVLFTVFTYGQLKGTPFPQISGKTLEGKTVNIPSDTKDKFTLIGLAYSRKAEDDLRSWFEPAYDKFITKLGMFDDELDVNTYFIAMFTGLKKGLMEASMKRMRQSKNKELFPHIIYYKGELEKYQEQLKLVDKEKPYFFVLDKQGNIVYNTSGSYSESKMDAIEELIME